MSPQFSMAPAAKSGMAIMSILGSGKGIPKKSLGAGDPLPGGRRLQRFSAGGRPVGGLAGRVFSNEASEIQRPSGACGCWLNSMSSQRPPPQASFQKNASRSMSCRQTGENLREGRGPVVAAP